MTKTKGFRITAHYFLPIDPKDFGKQAATFAAIDQITKSGQLPADFSDKATLLEVTAKQASVELPAAPAA